jgi:hypothetical protein
VFLVSELLPALTALAQALSDFLESGQCSGLGDNDEPPDRADVSAGGSVHSAVVAVEKAMSGKLPAPNPRNAWIRLTRARDRASDGEWQLLAHEYAIDFPISPSHIGAHRATSTAF